MEGAVVAGKLFDSGIGMIELGATLQQQPQHQQNQDMLASHPHLQGLAALPGSQQHMSSNQECEHSMDFLDFKESSKSMINCSNVKPCTSDENEASEGTDSRHSAGKDKKSSPWQRVKWTDAMVRFLIKAVMHLDDEIGTDAGTNGVRKKSGVLQKKGKWKSVSSFMLEKGEFFVSPQQCEDKFNDLNKRYKRLNDVLGRGTSCKVVENPALLDAMEHLSEKTKEDVRKILSSKHLFYEEMCFYHNGNRAHRASDCNMQTLTVPTSKDDNDAWRSNRDENGTTDPDEMENEVNGDVRDHNFDEDEKAVGAQGIDSIPPSSKRMKVAGKADPINSSRVPANIHDCPKFGGGGGVATDIAEGSGANPYNTRTVFMQKQWLKTRVMEVEQQKVWLQAQALELEEHRFKWQRICAKKDRDLKRMKLENERIKLENEQLALQLKQKELDIECSRTDISLASLGLSMNRSQGREEK